MISKIAYSAFAAATLLALMPLATAQGPSGGTGAVASIPGNVVRAAEQRQPFTQPGLISTITGATPPEPRRVFEAGDDASWQKPDAPEVEQAPPALAECIARLLSERWRCDTRQDKLDFRPLVKFAIKIEPATQTIRDDAVDDMQAEARAALIATRREERIECFASDTEAHAAAIIGKTNFDIVLAGRPNLDLDDAFLPIGKCVCDRVQEKVG
jgi:hypothetical protein